MRTSTVYRFTVSKFNRLAATGVFEDDRVELLGGVPTMMTTCPPHDYAVTRLGDFLEDCLSRERWTVREEKPIHLGRFWQPVPDLAVVRGAAKDFATRTPEVLDIALLVEVSDTTYAKDSGKKLRAYERAGVSTYWIVDLVRRRVEVREMGPRGLAIATLYQDADAVPVVLDGIERGRIVVADLLI